MLVVPYNVACHWRPGGGFVLSGIGAEVQGVALMINRFAGTRAEPLGGEHKDLPTKLSNQYLLVATSYGTALNNSARVLGGALMLVTQSSVIGHVQMLAAVS